MKTWVAWFATFLLLETYALIPGTRFPTLSQTWRELRDMLPGPWSIALTAATGGLFVWLLATHWLFSWFDRPGFDRAEALAIITGVLLGIAGGYTTRKRRDDEQPKV